MFSRRRLDRMESLQQSIHDQLATIVTALIVSEPRTGHAAEAFDGLRKSVNVAARHRWQHLTQLLSFIDSMERGATIETLKARCEEWRLQAGLQRSTDIAAKPDWFDVVEGEGPDLEVIDPAWVDVNAGQLINRGAARRVGVPASAAVDKPIPSEERAPSEEQCPAAKPKTSDEPEVPDGVDASDVPADAEEPAAADESSAAADPVAAEPTPAAEPPTGVPTEPNENDQRTEEQQ